MIHRAGHAEYDRETGSPIPQKNDKGFGEDKAALLQQALENSQDAMVDSDFAVQVNAIRALEALEDDVALNEAIGRLDKFMSKAGVSDQDNVGTYIIKSLDNLLNLRIPDLSTEGKKLVVKRIMEDYYGVIEGEPGPKRARGLETRQILKTINQPELDEVIKETIKNYAELLKAFIFPLEDIIHDFAVEMLRSLKSAFILDSDEELSRQRAEVQKAIDAIEGSGNEEAMEILQKQMEKLKNIEGVSSAAEGFVFDYEGNTYKFTGGFAPMNQILGLFKYGRKGIPALAEAEGGGQARHQNIALYPGKFKPPHGGHFNVAKQIISNPEVDKLIIFVSPREHDGINVEQAVTIWNYYSQYLPGDVEVRVADVSPVGSVYDYIDNEGEAGTDLHLILGEKDIGPNGRFKNAAPRAAGRGIEVAEVPLPPQMGGVSATQMRAALRSGKLGSFKRGLPVELNDSDINDIIAIL